MLRFICIAVPVSLLTFGVVLGALVELGIVK